MVNGHASFLVERVYRWLALSLYWLVLLAVRILTILAVFLGLLLMTRTVRLNISPSVPYGVYALHAVPPTLMRGELVLVPVPEHLFAFHPWWIPLLKPVAGLPGDVLTISDGRFYINAEDFGPVATESRGRPVPQIVSPRVVQPGEICIATTADKSLDCRYLGTTSVSKVQAVATPLLIWR